MTSPDIATTMPEDEAPAVLAPSLPMSRVLRRDVVLWVMFLALDTATQIAFKAGGRALAGIDFGPLWFERAFATPAVWMAIAGYVVAFVLWIAILQDSTLTRAFTLTGVAFATVPLAGWAFFGEAISLGRIAGIILIIVGVTLITRPHPPSPVSG